MTYLRPPGARHITQCLLVDVDFDVDWIEFNKGKLQAVADSEDREKRRTLEVDLKNNSPIYDFCPTTDSLILIGRLCKKPSSGWSILFEDHSTKDSTKFRPTSGASFG